MLPTNEISDPTMQDIHDRDAEINELKNQISELRAYPGRLDEANREITALRKQLETLPAMMSRMSAGSVPGFAMGGAGGPGIPMVPGPTPGARMSPEQVTRRIDTAATEFQNRLNTSMPETSKLAGLGGRMTKIEDELARLTGLMAKLVEINGG